jgi:phospholipid/cholesterol/gamma-HCH transport system substrate-binding protein
VKVGRVTHIRPDRRHGNVIVEFEVNRGVHLGPETRAEIALQTLLGTKYIRLSGPVQRPYLEDQPEQGRVIPVNRTTTPFDVFELFTVATHRVEQTHTEKLNQLIGQLADITQGNAADIHDLLDGLARVSTALSERDQQLAQLIERFDKVSKVLDDKDETLVGLIDQSQAVLALIERRRGDIAGGLNSAGRMADELSRLINHNKAYLDRILTDLHPTLDVVDRQQAHLDRALSWIGPGNLGLALATSHGPWEDISVRAVGPDYLQVLNDELTRILGAPAGASR